MNDVFEMELFRLLSGPSQVTNLEMENAYGCFMRHIATLGQSATDLPETFRTLGMARIELDSLGASFLYGKGEKRAEKNLPAQGDAAAGNRDRVTETSIPAPYPLLDQ